MTQDLYPFQVTGAGFLAGQRRAYLADDCGLGKTVQAAVAAKSVSVRSALIVAPASALENWYHEWFEWGPRKALFATISSASPKLDQLHGEDWDVVIVDEAHYCKTKNAQRTLRILRVARASKRAWLLSATPMPNHPGELWAPIRALWPEIPKALGIDSHWQWYDTFCRWVRTKHGPHAYGSKNTELLRPYLKQIMLRRLLPDVGLQLPPLRVDVSLLPRDKEFKAALAEYGIDADRLESRMAAEDSEEGSTSRLRRLLGEYKAPRIADIIAEELRTLQYKKIVVLAYHHSVLDVLTQKLKGFGVVGFRGGALPKVRQAAVDTFTDDPTVRVFLAQQTSAGISLNLQVANEIVLVEPSWSPDDDAQAVKRIHRIGSTLPCRARIFAVADTLDEGMQRVRAGKIRMQASLGLQAAGAEKGD